MRYPIVLVVALASCGQAPDVPGDGAARDAAPDGPADARVGPIVHEFDYATSGPARLSIMFTMAWFGVSASDGQSPPGADPGYLNWGAGGTPCAQVTADPKAVDTCILRGSGNACLVHGAAQRNISSRRRPLTGIWSGTGRDTESQRKIDLMLAMLRRPSCRADDGAKLDAWTMQLNSVKFSSKYVPDAKPSADFPYLTMLALYARADTAGIANAIIPGFDSTWYFHFGGSVGLGACDDTDGNPRQACLDATREDLRDLAVEALAHPSAAKVHGKPILFLYTDHWNADDQHHGGHQPTTAEWAAMLDAARTAAGTDFYVIAVSSSAESFAAFDVLLPWTGNSAYVDMPGTSVYDDAYAQTVARHAALLAAVGDYPGRLVYGGITPGFDDFTRNWTGPCKERQMPPDSPRDPAMMTAQADYMTGAGYAFRGMVGETWDDWTEGTEFEPDVEGGADRLVRLRQLIGRTFGDPADPDGDARLATRWTSFGQARDAADGAAGDSPVTDLGCDL